VSGGEEFSWGGNCRFLFSGEPASRVDFITFACTYLAGLRKHASAFRRNKKGSVFQMAVQHGGGVGEKGLGLGGCITLVRYKKTKKTSHLLILIALASSLGMTEHLRKKLCYFSTCEPFSTCRCTGTGLSEWETVLMDESGTGIMCKTVGGAFHCSN